MRRRTTASNRPRLQPSFWQVLGCCLGIASLALAGCSEQQQEFVPTWEPADAPPLLVELNQEISALADELDSPESPVRTVDQFDGFDAIDDTFDGVHPTVSGETKLAARWYEALGPAIAEHPAATPNVLLLGDSITDNHYRTILWRMLNDDELPFDFVGSQNSYPLRANVDDLTSNGKSFDTGHEGHTGWTADELLIGSEWDPSGGGGLDDWLTGYEPDIVALHIGTNDLIIGTLTPAEIAIDIGEVIARLRQANPDVVIYVAQIIPYLPRQTPADES